MGDRWLSEKEALKYSSLSRTRLKSARDASQLAYRIFDKCTVMYRESDIDKYITSNSMLYEAVG